MKVKTLTDNQLKSRISWYEKTIRYEQAIPKNHPYLDKKHKNWFLKMYENLEKLKNEKERRKI